ncbi:MAG: hypothetical protein AAGF53_02330 [Pseudomonadota bacterium]
MPYQLVENFEFGIDRRRPRHAGIPGTLWDAENVHLSRGGDLERSKRFVPVFTGLSGTHGLANLNGSTFVFGSQDLAASLPVGVQYQRLEAPSGAEMVRVREIEKFDNKLYVIAEFDDGNRYHYYDGARVTSWDAIAQSSNSLALTVAALADLVSETDSAIVEVVGDGLLLTAASAGTPFAVSASFTNGSGVDDQTAVTTELQANVTGQDGVAATADISVTGGTFNPGFNRIVSLKAGSAEETAIDLLGGPIDFVASDEATANSIALSINERTSEHGFSASISGSEITVSAPQGLGSSANSFSLYPAVSGDVTTSSVSSFTGGTDAIEAVAQITQIILSGTVEPDDLVTITIDGIDYKMTNQAAVTGTEPFVADSRVWAIAGPNLFYSRLNDATDWGTVTSNEDDPGFLVISTDSQGAQRLVGIETYQQNVALFADDAIVVYALGTLPSEFEKVQELPNTGTESGGSARAYGANDLFFLDSTGVRSLQARDSSNSAFVSDAGTVFDTYIQERISQISRGQLKRARSVIEPKTGMYWLSLGDQIMVLSNFPGTNIRGWTRYSPGFVPLHFVRTRDRVYARDADTIYLYGGLSGNEYPLEGEMPARVKLPFMTARDDAGFKHMTGFDMASENEWDVKMLIDPNNEAYCIDVGTFSGVTYSRENTEILGETTHAALEFECSAAGFASLTSTALHNNGSHRQ